MRSAWSASPTCCRERAASIARLSFQVSLLKWGKRQAMPMDSSFFCDWLFWRLAPPQMRTLNDASAAENPREASVSAGTALSPFSAIRKQSAPLCAVSSLDLCPLLNPCRVTGTSPARSWLLLPGSAPTPLCWAVSAHAAAKRARISMSHHMQRRECIPV